MENMGSGISGMCVIGRPWPEAEAMLRAAGIDFQTEKTRPARDFFKTAADQLYVVRQKQAADGTLQITLAARLIKEVS